MNLVHHVRQDRPEKGLKPKENMYILKKIYSKKKSKFFEKRKSRFFLQKVPILLKTILIFLEKKIETRFFCKKYKKNIKSLIMI